MREIFDSSNEKTRISRSNAAGSGLFPPFRGARGVNRINQKKKGGK
jgi:hypothetical protein